MRKTIACAMVLTCAVLVGGWSCESDPSKDSADPSSSIPLHPDPPASSETAAPVLQRDLAGRYVGGLAITGGQWQDVGPRQVIRLVFSASGLVGIGQFDLILTSDPPTDFDIGLSRFVPTPPFVTLNTGLERLDDGRIRFIGVDFRRSTHGDAELGTLELRTSSVFDSKTPVTLEVNWFSIGPSSSERDVFTREDLGVGVIVNGE